jgi:hypothetical protein
VDNAIAVAKWILTRDHITIATPITVQVSGRTYSGAKYTTRHNGSEEERIYVVGEMPPLHNRRRICYRTDDQSEDTWHLLAWQRSTCTEWQEVHFGNSHFLLARFSSLHSWAADQCGRTPYRRIPMTIMEVGPPISKVKEKHDDRG